MMEIEQLTSFYVQHAPSVCLQSSYGLECEWADIRRDLHSQKFTWAYTEYHVVNTVPPYRGVAMDPRGLNPPVGGELNFRPAHTPLQMAELVLITREWCARQGSAPNATMVGGTHCHVHVPGWGVEHWKKIARLASEESDRMIEKTALIPVGMEKVLHEKEARMLWGAQHRGGIRKIPPWMVENLGRAYDLETFLRELRRGSDGKTLLARPTRKSVNLLALGYPTNTIEFRTFGSTVNPLEVLSIGIFVQRFIAKALGFWDGDLYEGLRFPQCQFEEDIYEGWKATAQKYEATSADNKHRRLVREPLPRPEPFDSIKEIKL